MTCLEHLINNCLCDLERDENNRQLRYEDFLAHIEKDPNLPYSGITSEQCWMICQFVWYSFMERYK